MAAMIIWRGQADGRGFADSHELQRLAQGLRLKTTTGRLDPETQCCLELTGFDPEHPVWVCWTNIPRRSRVVDSVSMSVRYRKDGTVRAQVLWRCPVVDVLGLNIMALAMVAIVLYEFAIGRAASYGPGTWVGVAVVFLFCSLPVPYSILRLKRIREEVGRFKQLWQAAQQATAD